MSKKEDCKLELNFVEVQDLLTALGDEKRQLILMAFLKQTTSEGIRVPELTELTNLSRPAVSHHLKILKDAGVLSVRQEGTKNYYQLAESMGLELKKLKELLNQLLGVLGEKAEQSKL